MNLIALEKEMPKTSGKMKTYKQMLDWVIGHPNVTIRATKVAGFIAYDTSEGLCVLAKVSTYEETIQLVTEKIE